MINNELIKNFFFCRQVEKSSHRLLQTFQRNLIRFTKICLLSLILFWSEERIAQDSISIPSPIASGTKVSELIPVGWSLLKKAEGDLNKDGLNDLVFVLRHMKEEKENSPESRILLIYLKDKMGKFQLQENRADFILKMDEGGMMGDPFQDISIQRGSILIEHSGGSRERWMYKHRFQFRDTGFFLIGRTETLYDSATGDSKTTDSNLLTGKTEITEEKANKKPTKRALNLGKKTLLSLKEVKLME